MEKYNRILGNEDYQSYIRELARWEQDRIYCRHTIEHFLDVARVLYILVLEQGLAYSKDEVYGVALLHDIGRVLQYEKGIPHEEAGVELASPILEQAGYQPDEITLITSAIGKHRVKEQSNHSLAHLLYVADKKTRLCFQCTAKNSCNWEDTKKNKLIWL